MRIVSKEPEAHLIELLNLVQEQRQGWQAVAFNFSRLLEHYRSEYQLKIATNLMNDLLGDRDGAIYLCDDANIYVMVRHLPKPLMDKMVFQLRYLFMDDPFAYSIDGEENPEFAQSYNIETDWETFMESCKRRLIQRVRKTQSEQRSIPRATNAAMAAAGVAPIQFPRVEMRYFTAHSLIAIENTLKETDITASIRRQPVVAVMPDASVRTVFDEMYINIASLRQSLGTEVDLLSNRWLFKYLTQKLDDRMLEAVQKNPPRYLANPVSLNLNIPTLLSTRFAEFDAAIKPSAKVSLVVELQIGDVFNDISGFLLAKDTVQKLGYRVCLDGVTDVAFPQIDRQRLGFDLIKLQWNGDESKDADSEKNQRLAEAIRKCGTKRVILTRCDNALAVEYGQSIGISLFQGRYLDLMLNPNSDSKN
jgi:hypothetical protein